MNNVKGELAVAGAVAAGDADMVRVLSVTK
jgi:hypothetical protein